MARPRTVPDTEIYATVRDMLRTGGDKAVAFGTVARQTGLAAPSLVQRYGNRDGMIRAALLEGWESLTQATMAADTAEATSQGLLKALTDPAAEMAEPALMAPCLRDPALRDAAAHWRSIVHVALARRLGGGAKGAEAAAILFAAWQGRLIWESAGGKGFRLKDATRRLA